MFSTCFWKYNEISNFSVCKITHRLNGFDDCNFNALNTFEIVQRCVTTAAILQHRTSTEPFILNDNEELSGIQACTWKIYVYESSHTTYCRIYVWHPIHTLWASISLRRAIASLQTLHVLPSYDLATVKCLVNALQGKTPSLVHTVFDSFHLIFNKSNHYFHVAILSHEQF